MHRVLKYRKKNTVSPLHLSPSLLALAACGGGGGGGAGSSSVGTSSTSTSNIPITGDAYIDGLNFGIRYDKPILNIAVSGGIDGEYWVDPQMVLQYFDQIVYNTLKFTDLQHQSIGAFDDPASAAASGSDITLVPYISNILNLPYNVLGVAYPVGYQFIAETSTQPELYEGVEGDILINFGGVLGDVDLPFSEGSEGYLVVLHELGHSLGLKHPHDNIGSRLNFERYNISTYDLDEYTVMSYNDNSNSYVSYDPITPMVLDVIALQFMYGKNIQINAGDTSHQIIHTGTYYTIWDPSGDDTIDLSASQWDWYVELPSIISSPIHGEYIGVALTDEGGVAPTDLIWLIGNMENIKGGSGSDILVGNHLNNFISGGPGDDYIYGQGGNNVLQGDQGNDFFVISLGGGKNTIKDYKFLDDKFAIVDVNGNNANSQLYSTEYDSSGNLQHIWSDGTLLTFEGVTENKFGKTFSIVENDVGDTSDYDYVVIDTKLGTITLHIEDFNFFDLVVADLLDGSSRKQFALYVTDTPSEDPAYVSPGFNDFEWRNAEEITAQDGVGLSKTITITDAYIQSFNLDSDFDYVGFMVASDNYYAGDDFLISNAAIV